MDELIKNKQVWLILVVVFVGYKIFMGRTVDTSESDRLRAEMGEALIKQYGMEQNIKALEFKAAQDKLKEESIKAREAELKETLEKQKKLAASQEQKAMDLSTLRSKLRANSYPEAEWKSMLVGRSKTQVIDLLGTPSRYKAPKSTDIELRTFMIYANKVKQEESGTLKDLVVSIDEYDKTTVLDVFSTSGTSLR